MSTPTYNLMAIKDGREGIRQTLRLMAQISKKYASSPIIRELALKIVSKTPEKNWTKEAAAILRFVQNNVRYTKDILGVETLQTPVQTLRIRQGDCDDTSMLAASLMLAIGHPVRFVAVGKVKGSLSHVYPETKIAGRWLPMETTEYWPLGKGPRGVKDKMIEHV